MQSPFEGNPRTVEDYGRVAATNPVVFKDEDGLDEEARDVLLWLLSKPRANRTRLDEIKGHTFFSAM